MAKFIPRNVDPCDCGEIPRYFINFDHYKCLKCGAIYDVLEVENDHIAYHGRKPKETVDG
jgi:hypothetical protein